MANGKPFLICFTQHVALITWSSFCGMRHPFAYPDMWPAINPKLNTEDYLSSDVVCLKFKLLYNTTSGCFHFFGEKYKFHQVNEFCIAVQLHF